MTSPFLGEIQIFGFNFPPYEWAFAAGQTLSIQQNSALFSLIGTYYGGNGTSTFQLPNLISRAPCNQGQGPGLTDRLIGEAFGEQTVTLSGSEMPSHAHILTPSNPTGTVTKTAAPQSGSSFSKFGHNPNVPNNPTPNATLAANTVGMTGSNTPHANQQPFLALNFSISLYGQFPTFP